MAIRSNLDPMLRLLGIPVGGDARRLIAQFHRDARVSAASAAVSGSNPGHPGDSPSVA